MGKPRDTKQNSKFAFVTWRSRDDPLNLDGNNSRGIAGVGHWCVEGLLKGGGCRKRKLPSGLIEEIQSKRKNYNMDSNRQIWFNSSQNYRQAMIVMSTFTDMPKNYRRSRVWGCYTSHKRQRRGYSVSHSPQKYDTPHPLIWHAPGISTQILFSYQLLIDLNNYPYRIAENYHTNRKNEKNYGAFFKTAYGAKPFPQDIFQ